MPILKEDELDIISHSKEQTQRLGVRLGKLLEPGDVICLSGDMGAGKTVFSAGIGMGWGAKYPLTSPTYNLVHEHRREKDKQKLYHLDCYRLKDESEVDTIGLDDILNGKNVVILEWPERIIDALPESRLWIRLRVIESTRRNLLFEGEGDERYSELVKKFRELAYGV